MSEGKLLKTAGKGEGRGREDRGEREDRNAGGEEKEGRDSYRRRRSRPPVDLTFDYKDTDGLKQFLAEGGKIVPARVSRLSRGQQRQLTTEVKRARQLALLPISDRHENG
jgi:small subunit ribosomal protein S18